MKLEGEIILIDGDKFEEDFLHEALKRLGYDVNVVFLESAKDGYDYLNKTQNEIFLIISEIDFDKMSGLDLKKLINESDRVQWKSTPFIFIANNLNKSVIDEAYRLGIHGFFKKPSKLQDLTDMFSVIIKYWIMNWHPNKSEAFYNATN